MLARTQDLRSQNSDPQAQQTLVVLGDGPNGYYGLKGVSSASEPDLGRALPRPRPVP